MPVVPVAMRGDAALLPGERWWPRRTAIEVDIGTPLGAAADVPDVFAAAVRLREGARRAIATVGRRA